MCGRFALSMTPADLARVFGTRNAVPNFAPTWNLPPSQLAPVVRHNPKAGERHLDLLRWGLIPHFERDPAHARMLNNARAETVAKLPSFRGAFVSRRCIVPADAFYEWKRDGKLKQPFAIARADGAPLAFGGIWESWTDPINGDIIRTFAIITTDANATMASIHNRMPLVLEPADWPVWLGEEEGAPKVLLRPAADTVLRAWPVGTDVNSVRNNGPDLLRPMLEEGVGGGQNSA
jgi:putative SOS response-associated peptidase YedK